MAKYIVLLSLCFATALNAQLVEITKVLAYQGYDEMYFDSTGISEPLEEAIYNSKYKDRIYAKSGWIVYARDFVFELDSSHVDESKLQPKFEVLRKYLQDLRNEFGEYQLKRTSEKCNDSIQCQGFELIFEDVVNVKRVEEFIPPAVYWNIYFTRYPAKLLGIELGEIKEIKFQNHPDKIIFTDSQVLKHKIEIFDIRGILVKTTQLNSKELDISYLNIGTYILRINNQSIIIRRY